MSTRHKGIIAYGTEEDRKRLTLLAQAFNCSNSELIIRMIREKFADIYGDVKLTTMDQP